MTDLSSLTADQLAEPMLKALALELPAEVLADVRARVAELQTRANQHDNVDKELGRAIDREEVALARAEAAEARTAKLEAALTRYAHHDHGCMAAPPFTGGGPIDAPQACTCGLDAVLADLDAEDKP